MFAILLTTDLDTSLTTIFIFLYTCFGIIIVSCFNIASNSVFSIVQLATLIGLPVNSFVLFKILLLSAASLNSLFLIAALLLYGAILLFIGFAVERNVICLSVYFISTAELLFRRCE